MRIEVIHVRDPDSACEIEVYVDGVLVAHEEYNCDAGAGYLRQDWDETTEVLAERASANVGRRIKKVRDDAAASSAYIE